MPDQFKFWTMGRWGNDDAARDIPMAAKRLGRAVDDEVGTVKQGLQQVRRGKRAIDHHGRAVSISQRGYQLKVDYLEQRVRDYLCQHDFRTQLADSALDLIEVCHVEEADVHPLACEDRRQQGRCGTIHILSRDYSDA